MEANKIKALAINVKSSTTPPGIEYQWAKIPQLPEFTKNIIIPEISVDKDGNTSVDIGSIVSGMPTVFARANMFRNALDNITDTKAEASGLMLFYTSLISEWKGFISCMALNYKDLEIDRIHLAYSDGKNISETSNIYEPIGAFGNVLFERKPLWCDQSLAYNNEKIPFIDVISLNGNVIGGSSPDSFLFTSVSYKIKEKYPFVSVINGRFINPLQSDLKFDQLAAIYGYVKYILNNINKFEANFNGLEDSLKPNYGNISGCLQNWLGEMVKYQEAKGFPKMDNQNPPEVGSIFEYPFSLLFNYSTELYGVNGQIYNDNSTDGSIAFDPKDLLLPLTTEIAQIRFGGASNKKNYLQTKPILLLETTTLGQPNDFVYFALPLTPLALNLFGAQLDALVGLDESSNVKSRISAIYDPNNKDGEILEVTLTLYTAVGAKIEKNAKYKVNKESIRGKDILIWPNFISKQWNRYFLYSEIPHNDVKFQATPFIGDVNDDFFRIVLDEKNGTPLYLADKGKTAIISDKNSNIKCQLHVASNHAIADNAYKYEIYESNQPFKGVKFSFNGVDCGFGIIRYQGSETTADKPLPHNMLSIAKQLIPARLGVDFGSTNSSIAYYSDGDNKVCDSLTLKNRRVSLLGDDAKDNNERPAVENEIFFFQNEEILTNSIKSILTVHDSRRLLNENNIQPESLAEQAVKGGFPCFEKNLPIENAQNNRYTLGYNRVGKAEIVYNMKWSDQPIDKAYKKAYLSSLLLHVYAQLFIENHEPKFLKWSYPSSMGDNLKITYRGIWDSMKDISPIADSAGSLVIHPPSADIGDTSGKNSWDTGGAGTEQESIVDSSPNSGWGSSDNSSNAWGSPAPTPTASGWGADKTIKKKVVEIETETAPINFKFRQLADDESLTESCAVANYLLRPQGGFGLGPGELVLCFDIGGSTTDISALCQMDGERAMVKQNSIRFAAQRISEATKYSPNFRAVLLKMCEIKKIKIEGLNTPNNKFSENTASYYFEQIVDRLEVSEFDDFYRLLAAECKEMMSVNLYVTGLIMYYAGQLTQKLRSEIVKSEDATPIVKATPPKIRIAFAGKGARIFDWFNAVNPKAANDYYTQMFIRGIGGEAIAKVTITPVNFPSKIIDINNQKADNNSDVKYEVSKGLAIPTSQTKLFVPTNKTAIEVLGEENFCVVTPSGEVKYLEASNSITTQMMEYLGSNFVCLPPAGKVPCPRFMDFADLYYKVASNMFGLKMSQADFMNGFNDMNIENYIKGEKDYIDAQKRKADQKEFDYVAPIIILEGMKFFENHLLKSIKAQK
jgi:hypothetical protein